MKYLLVSVFAIMISTSNYSQELEWAFSMGGIETDHARSIVTDSNNNVYATGFFTGTSDYDPSSGIAEITSNGMQDIFITKLNSEGNFMWVRSIGGVNEDTANDIFIDANNDIYVTGVFYGTVDFDPGTGSFELSAEGDYDGFLLKMNSDGEFLWAIKIGGENLDNSYSVAIDSSFNVFVSGYFQGTVDFDPGIGVQNIVANGEIDLYIVKLDSNGDFIWVKTVGGTGIDDIIVNYGISLDPSQNLVLSGYYGGTIDFDPGVGIQSQTSNGLKDAFILKLNSNGDYLWNIGFGSEEGFESSYELKTDSLGNIYVSGAFSYEMDVDPGVGTFILTATNGAIDNAFVIKYDEFGELVWANSFGGNLFTRSYSMTLDNAEQPVVLIKYSGTVDFDPGADEYLLTSNGSFDVALVRLKDDGTFYWARSMGGTDTDFPLSVVTDTHNDILITGYFLGISDYDPGNGVFNLQSAGFKDVFLVKITNDVLSISDNNLEPNLIVYPNPTEGAININTSQIMYQLEVNIWNNLGQLVHSDSRQFTNHMIVNLTSEAGMYFCEIRLNGNFHSVIKIIKK